MIRIKIILAFLLFVACQMTATAQEQTHQSPRTFTQAAEQVQQQLQASVKELNALREKTANEKIPLSRKLRDLESELAEVRIEYQNTTRLLDSRTLDLNNLQAEIKSRQQEAGYLSNLLGEYIRNFESRLHIAEIQRYREPLETAKLAPENKNLSEHEIYEAQAGILTVSLDRLYDALGGSRFEGTAVDSGGKVQHGTFVMVGPAALFRSDDGTCVGTVEQRLGSLEPSVIPFGNPLDSEAAAKMITDSAGLFPFDPTLGNAHKIEETKESFVEHIKKGGPVMYPIFILAGAALLVAIYKWLSLSFLRKPSQRKLDALLDAIAKHDEAAVRQTSGEIAGPVGKMLQAGVEHLKEPRDLIEEVMYEKVLAMRLKLQRLLPFIAISASSAPLLGLLGTVTGIINTFKLITVFGSGDVKTLSGGISEALITTEYGLIVAIPSLLMHAFLSRKARGVVDQMEKTAVIFVNQISQHPFYESHHTNGSSNLTSDQVQDMLERFGSQYLQGRMDRTVQTYSGNSAGELMKPHIVSVKKNVSVADAIKKIQMSGIDDDVDAVYIVDDHDKFVGHVLVRQLLTRPEQTSVGSLVRSKSTFVRVDTHQDDVWDLFNKHDLIGIPVLDHNDRLVGRITRNGNCCKV